jgi:hypothetical protein
MMDEPEDLHMIRLRALENIEKNKLRVAKYYSKKVKVRQFAEEDLVWKALLPIGTKYSEFGKWSPNWKALLPIGTKYSEFVWSDASLVMHTY